MSNPTAEHLVSAGKVYAATKRPYFAPGLHAMVLVETRAVPTLAVDEYWRCYYNPDLIVNYPVPVIAGFLTHELGHLIRAHASRARAIPGINQDKWNCAGDCEINDDIITETKNTYSKEPLTPLPEWVLTPEKFNLKPYQLAETYYSQIPDPPQQPGGGQGNGQGGEGNKDGQGSGKVGGGDCGSAATGKAGSYELPPPTDSKDASGITEGEAELIRRQIAMEVNRIAESAEGRGKLPAGLKRWAEEYLHPQVNYTKWVRSLLRNAFTEARGKGDYTFRRPSRRQSAFGKWIRPGLVQPKIRVGFIIDTSGSMSDTQLGQCIAEIRGFASRCAQHAELYAISCDAAVHTVQKLENPKHLELYGGGGTDMVVAFDKFAGMRPQIDLIICLTDCLTPWPAEKPAATTVIVALGNGALPSWPCHSVKVEPHKP